MQAVTAKGQTPASNSPTDIATAISGIGEGFYNAELVYRATKSSSASKELTVSDTYTLKESGYYLAFLGGFSSTLNTAYTVPNTSSLLYNSSASFTSDGNTIVYGQGAGGGTIHDYSKYAIFSGVKDKTISFNKYIKSDYYNVCAATAFGLFRVEQGTSLLYKTYKTGTAKEKVTISASYNISTAGKYLVIAASHGAAVNAGYTDAITGIKTTIKFNDNVVIDLPVNEKMNVNSGNNQGSISSDVEYAFVEGTGTVYVERYYCTHNTYTAFASLELFIFKIG